VDIRYRNERQFLVKWVGWSEEDNTWEKEDALEGTTFIHDFLEEFYDDNVEDIAPQLKALCRYLPVVDKARLEEENRKALETKKAIIAAVELQQNAQKGKRKSSKK